MTETTSVETTLLFEVTDLKQWTYCPRVLFYRYCLPDVRPVTDLMRAGIGSHSDEVGREERRSLRTYGLSVGERAFDVGLHSPTLGLRGRLDLAIAVPDRTAPMPRRSWWSTKTARRQRASISSFS